MALVCWEDTIAVGFRFGGITTFNTITGSQIAVLLGHTCGVGSLAFSFDSTLLVSGSDDETIKLWDVQTGGAIKTFHGHTHLVSSVSISLDNAILASGSWDNSIRLWGIWTGECLCVIDGHSGWVKSVSFSPTNSQHLISASNDNTIQQWSIDGFRIGPTYEGCGVAFSLDGTHFVSWRQRVATVQNFGSGAVITKLQAPSDDGFDCCCFSPSSEFVAGSISETIYVWDITCSDPHLFKTLDGHSDAINAITFSSSLISASDDHLIKFWQIGTSLTDPVSADPISTLPTSASIESISLQVKEGIIISSDSDRMVKFWDISTGICKASFQAPAEDATWKDAQLIEGRLILVWHAEEKLYIWDIGKDEFLQTIDTSISEVDGLKISGDGSRVFCLTKKLIQSWSIWTGAAAGKVELTDEDVQLLDPLCMDGSRIWVCSRDSSVEGWDFGILSSSPISLSTTFPDRPHLHFICGTRWWGGGTSRIKDTLTGKEIFHLIGRYMRPDEVQWDGRYLVAGYESGEVLILDFNHVVSQ